MNKFDEVLKELDRLSGVSPRKQEILGFFHMNQETIRTALTQAAEIERGNKVVVDREPTRKVLKAMHDCGEDAPWLVFPRD